MIYRPDLFLPAFSGLPSIEAALCLISKNSAPDHLRQKFRSDENLALVIIQERFVKILDYVAKHIQAH